MRASLRAFPWQLLLLISLLAGGLIGWASFAARPAHTARPGNVMYLPFVAAEYPRILGDDFFTGCAMAHCSPDMSDNANMEAPVGDVARIWGPDRAAGGSTYGVGCTANTKIAACAYFAGLTVYDGAGHIKWQKDLGIATWTSAPIVTPYSTVLAASAGKLVHYDRFGDELWVNTEFQGFAISPVILQPQAIIIVATGAGDLYAFDLWTGEHLAGPVAVEHRVGPRVYACRTWNTPGVRVGYDRFYVSADCSISGSNSSFLMAYDFDLTSEHGFTQAWGFPYTGYSGASPTVISDRIYFDGNPRSGLDIPHVYGIRDRGNFAEELWRREMNGPLQTSMAHDPRGGLWVFTLRWANDQYAAHPEVRRLDENTGAVLQSFRIDQLVADDPEDPPPATPASIMTIASGPNGPIMIIAAMVPMGEGQPLCEVRDAWIVAVDLNGSYALWKIRTPFYDAQARTHQFFPTQFAFLDHPADKRKVIITAGSCIGAMGISRLFTGP